MAIASKRFTILSDETNLPSSPFGAGKIDDIINTAENELKSAIQEAQDLIKTTKASDTLDDVKKLFSSAKDGFEEYSRDIKSIAGKLTNYKGAPENLVGDLMKSMTGAAKDGSAAALSKTAMDMMRRCGRGSSYGFGGRPYDISANCSGGKASLGKYGTGSGCNSSSFSDLLNKLTGGNYGKASNDITAALRSLMALAGSGYKLGMCGVFGGLFSSGVFDSLGLGNNEYGKAAGNLLGILGKGGNVKGWIDVAKASTGLFPSLTNPASLDELLTNFEKPEYLGDVDQVALMEQLRGGQELYDENWMVNGVGELSMPIMDEVTQDYKDLSEVWVSNRVYDETELDLIPEDLDTSLSVAVVGYQEPEYDDFSSFF